MTPETVVTIGRQALELMLIVSAPLLLVALFVGLVVSFFQAITQLNEQTLSFLPKLIAVAATLVVIGPWMITTLVDYLQRTLIGIFAAGVAGSTFAIRAKSPRSDSRVWRSMKARSGSLPRSTAASKLIFCSV